MASPNRFSDDGFNLAAYFNNWDFDTAGIISAYIARSSIPVRAVTSSGSPYEQKYSGTPATDIPQRIIDALVALAKEIKFIGERANKATDGAAGFNTADGIISAATTGAAFIPVVGLALAPLIGLLGGVFSSGSKKRHQEAIAADANDIITTLTEEYNKLLALQKQYPVQSPQAPANTANSLGVGGTGNNSTLLVAGALVVGGILYAKRKKKRKK